jgi:hypothetical protein
MDVCESGGGILRDVKRSGSSVRAGLLRDVYEPLEGASSEDVKRLGSSGMFVGGASSGTSSVQGPQLRWAFSLWMFAFRVLS